MAVRVGHTTIPGSSNSWNRNVDIRDFIGEPPEGATGYMMQWRFSNRDTNYDFGVHPSGDPDELFSQTTITRFCSAFPIRSNGNWLFDWYTGSATNGALLAAGWLTEVNFANDGDIITLPATSGFEAQDFSAEAGISDGTMIIRRAAGGQVTELGIRMPGESQSDTIDGTVVQNQIDWGYFYVPLVGGIVEIDNDNESDFIIVGTMLPDQYEYVPDGTRVIAANNTGSLTWPETYPEIAFAEFWTERDGGIASNSDQAAYMFASNYDTGTITNQRGQTHTIPFMRALNDNGSIQYRVQASGMAQDFYYRGGYLANPGDGGPPQPTPPVLTDPTHENMDDQGADVSVSTNKVEGIMFMVAAVGAENDEQPTAAQIKAGQDATGAPAAFDDSEAVTGSPVQFSITGVENLRVYHYWFVQEDEEDTPLDSNIVGDVFVTFDRDFDPNRVFVNNVPEITDDVVQQAVITIADGEIALGPLNLSSFPDGEIFVIHTYENPEGEVEFTNILNEEKDDDEAPGPKYVQATLADLEGNLIINETGIIWAFYEQVPEVGTPPNNNGNWETDENGVISLWVNDSALEFGDFGYLALTSTNEGWHAIHRVEVYENTDPGANNPGQGQG